MQLPGECTTFPSIPEYLAAIYADITEHLIPSFLRSTSEQYMVFGGRASNNYGTKHVLSSDWDIVLITNGTVKDRLYKTTNFAEAMKVSVNQQLPTNLTSIITVEKRMTELSASQFLFRVGLVDPYYLLCS